MCSGYHPISLVVQGMGRPRPTVWPRGRPAVKIEPMPERRKGSAIVPIQDALDEFRAGRMAEGIWRGAAALANRIATDRGVQLTGVPAPRAAPPPATPQIPPWVFVLALIFFMLLMSRMGGGSGLRGGRGPVFIPGGFGGFGGGRGGGGFGGFGGGGGGFGGFGGGGFGGGGSGGGGASGGW